MYFTCIYEYFTAEEIMVGEFDMTEHVVVKVL